MEPELTDQENEEQEGDDISRDVDSPMVSSCDEIWLLAAFANYDFSLHHLHRTVEDMIGLHPSMTMKCRLLEV